MKYTILSNKFHLFIMQKYVQNMQSVEHLCSILHDFNFMTACSHGSSALAELLESCIVFVGGVK